MVKAKKANQYTEIGKMIKKKLIDRNMTTTQLAACVGTTPQYMNHILHGKRSGKKYLAAIAKILDLDIAA